MEFTLDDLLSSLDVEYEASVSHAKLSTSMQQLKFNRVADKSSLYVTTIKPWGNWEFCIDDTIELEWSADRSKIASVDAIVVEVDYRSIVCHVVVKPEDQMLQDCCSCRKIPHLDDLTKIRDLVQSDACRTLLQNIWRNGSSRSCPSIPKERLGRVSSHFTLEPTQAMALDTCMSFATSAISGMAGSGKSHVLMAMLLANFLDNRRVLVTCPSNVPTIASCRKGLDESNLTPPLVVRLYSSRG